MSKSRVVRVAMFMLLTGLSGAAVYAQTIYPLTFTGTIGASVIENNQRRSDHPAMLVVTLLDANGYRIKLCNTALLEWNMAVSMTNAQAAAFQQTVSQAQTNQTKVTVVASENTTDSDGIYCGIQSITAAQ